MAAEWICNKCGEPATVVDADTMMGEFDGIETAYVCENCESWWFVDDGELVDRVIKGEKDCEAKMA